VPRLADADARRGGVQADADPPRDVLDGRQRGAALGGGDHVADLPPRGVVGSEVEQLPRVLGRFVSLGLGRVAQPPDQVQAAAGGDPRCPSGGAVAAADPYRLAVFADKGLTRLVLAPELRAVAPQRLSVLTGAAAPDMDAVFDFHCDQPP
jgi:hypothetical protein